MSSNIFPGAHPSSEGKRRRNRSNVEAMASKSVDTIVTSNKGLLFFLLLRIIIIFSLRLVIFFKCF